MLFIHPHGSARGGPYTYLREVLRGMPQAGWSARVALLHGGPLASELASMDVPVAVLDAGGRRDARGFARTVRALARLASQADVVVSNGAREHLYGGPAALLARRPAVWCCHNPWVPDSRSNQVGARIPVRAIVANSAYTVSMLPRRLRPKARHVHFGVRLPADPAELAQAADRFRADEGLAGPLLACLGGLSELKGQHVLVEAMPAILQRFPAAVALLVGAADQFAGEQRGAGAPYVQRLNKTAQQLGLSGAVRLLGFRTDVAAILAAADIVIHPSIGPETFGFAIAEGMAAGKPVIASDIGAQRELVRPGKTGLLVPPGDAAALAGACATLLADAALRDAYGREARRVAEASLTVERMVKESLDLFAEVVAH